MKGIEMKILGYLKAVLVVLILAVVLAAFWEITKDHLPPLINPQEKGSPFNKAEDDSNDEPSEEVKELVEKLASTDKDVQKQTVLQLHKMGLKAWPGLQVCLQDKNPRIRVLALRALGKPEGIKDRAFSKKYDRRILPLLILTLSDENSSVRLETVRSLGPVCLGAGQSDSILNILLSALSDVDPAVQKQVIETVRLLVQNTPDKERMHFAIFPLRRILESSADDQTRIGAARTLGDFGPIAKDSVSILKRMLSAGSPELRLASAGALWRIRKSGTLVMPVFLEGLNDPRDKLRKEAVRELGELGAEALETIPLLQTLAKTDPSSEVRQAATGAIQKIQPD